MRCEGEHGVRSRPCLLQLALEGNGNPSKIPFPCLPNGNELRGDESVAGCTAGFRGTFRKRAEQLALQIHLTDRETEAQPFLGPHPVPSEFEETVFGS